MNQEIKKPSSCVMSLKRINQIKEIMIRYYGEKDVDKVIHEICEAINFNPDYAKGRYTPEIGKRFTEWRTAKKSSNLDN